MERKIRDGIQYFFSSFTQYYLLMTDQGPVAVVHKTETGSEAITQLAGQLQLNCPDCIRNGHRAGRGQENVLTRLDFNVLHLT